MIKYIIVSYFMAGKVQQKVLVSRIRLPDELLLNSIAMYNTHSTALFSPFGPGFIILFSLPLEDDSGGPT